MTKQEFLFIEDIRTLPDDELNLLANECNQCFSSGTWPIEGEMVRRLVETFGADGVWPTATSICIAVALEFMKRNALPF